MTLTKKQRQQVWLKSKGLCWYCGEDLPEKGWHVDHIEPVFRSATSPTKVETPFGKVPESIQLLLDNKGMEKPENDTIENMVPACAPCNLFKSVFSVDGFRKEIEAQIERARKSSVNFRTAERFKLVEVKPAPVVFWFEKQGFKR